LQWLTFILFAACMLTLQSALAPRVELFGSRPDWLLVVVVFFALRARPIDAIVGAWLIGVLADLMTIERLGLIALSYGVAAGLVASIRDALFRYGAWTQFVVTLLVCVVIQGAWCCYRRLLYDPAQSVFVDLTLGVLLTSVYTAAWAPLFHWLLSPMSRLLGLPRPRYAYPGLSRVGDVSV
jgi:rod shape-determining protein MreD